MSIVPTKDALDKLREYIKKDNVAYGSLTCKIYIQDHKPFRVVVLNRHISLE